MTILSLNKFGILLLSAQIAILFFVIRLNYCANCTCSYHESRVPIHSMSTKELTETKQQNSNKFIPLLIIFIVVCPILMLLPAIIPKVRLYLIISDMLKNT